MKSLHTPAIQTFARSAAKAASLGVSMLALTATGVLAQQPRDTVVVTGQRANELSSPRYTAPILNTPQTVTVVNRETIEQQNLLGLRDILSTLPGITFGAGEGGGGYGDSINLRGYTASGDITSDGVRDSAQYSRTDPFNLEQVELSNGANSVYGGSGSVGGTINLATKRPLAFNRNLVTAGVGTDDYYRATADLNRTFGANAAGRLNLMAHRNDVPDRNVEQYQRWGVAPSLRLGLAPDTQVTFLYAHQEDDNIPQFGVPFAINAYNDGVLPGVSESAYLGYADIDSQNVTFDSATIVVDHRFNDVFSLRNLTRWQEVSQLSITSALQGTFCLASGINPYTGAACAARNTYAPAGPRGNLRDSVNEILVNQLDLVANFETGALQHTLVVGASVSEETYYLQTGNVLRNPRGVTPNPAAPTVPLNTEVLTWSGPVNRIYTGGQDNKMENVALYAFDRIQFGPQWELNGGLRYDNNEGVSRAFTIATPYPVAGEPVTTLGARNINKADLFSYRLGLVYKPVENASIYAAYGTSESPSQSTVNGSCTAATCNVDPEEAVNYEIGAKYALFGGNLLLTGSIFRNERTNFRVASGDPAAPEQQLDGSSHVDGVALGASGQIAPNWTVFANYTYLDSEIDQNISDFLIGAGTVDFVAGDPLPNTPKHSGSIWTTYELDFGLLVGYGVTYQGEFTFNRTAANAPLYYTDDYWVHRAMLRYPVTGQATLQLNVNNVWDNEGYERVRNTATSGWATPVNGRSAVLSLEYAF